MGAEDIERQKLNVFRMRLLGSEVVSVKSGSKTLKDAINEAMRDWVTNVGIPITCWELSGPHPFPMICRDFQSVIGREARRQISRWKDASRRPHRPRRRRKQRHRALLRLYRR